MGRQHTTWISEENWKKLENIGGDSISAKIGRAIEQADPDREMAFNAKMRQLERAQEALRRLKYLFEMLEHDSPKRAFIEAAALFEDIWWLLE